jgi:hypothetical protein
MSKEDKGNQESNKSHVSADPKVVANRLYAPDSSKEILEQMKRVAQTDPALKVLAAKYLSDQALEDIKKTTPGENAIPKTMQQVRAIAIDNMSKAVPESLSQKKYFDFANQVANTESKMSENAAWYKDFAQKHAPRLNQSREEFAHFTRWTNTHDYHVANNMKIIQEVSKKMNESAARFAPQPSLSELKKLNNTMMQSLAANSRSGEIVKNIATISANATRVADEAFTKTANVVENTANKARNYAKGFVEDVNTKIAENKAAAQDPAKIKQLTGYIKAIEKIAKDNNAIISPKFDDYMKQSGVTKQTSDYNRSVTMAKYINNISQGMLINPPKSMSQSQKTFLSNIGNLANNDIRIANPDKITTKELQDRAMTLEQVKSQDLKDRDTILQKMGAVTKAKPVISPETKRAAIAIGSVARTRLSEKAKNMQNTVTKFAKKQLPGNSR